MPANGTALRSDDLLVAERPTASRAEELIGSYVAGDASRFEKRLNIPACLWPPVWLLYRKMYTAAAVTLLGPILCFVAFPSFAKIKFVGLSVTYAGRVANRLYLRQAARVVARIESEDANEAEIAARVAAAGGVSKSGAALGVMIVLLSTVAVIVSGRLGQPK